MKTVTNYTTYDMAYYYADLRQTYRLSQEERCELLAISTLAHNPEQRKQAQHQLMTSYLHFAKAIAIEHCPRSLCGRLLPDLIGEVNLALVQTISRRDPSRKEEITPYLAATICGKIKSVLSRDGLIHVPYDARVRAREQGTREQLRVLEQVLSLDEQMEWFNTDELEEPPTFLLTPSEPAPERNPELRAQVETYLSYLSDRAQSILRLRYGLCDENERCYSTAEIARLLSTTRDVVLVTERDALKRLRALTEGRATLIMRKGKPTISYPQINDRPLPAELEAQLEQVSSTLFAQEGYVSVSRLSQAAGVSQGRAAAFLRTRRGETGE